MTATVGDTLYAVKDNHLYSCQLGQADVTDLGARGLRAGLQQQAMRKRLPKRRTICWTFFPAASG